MSVVRFTDMGRGAGGRHPTDKRVHSRLRVGLRPGGGFADMVLDTVDGLERGWGVEIKDGGGLALVVWKERGGYVAEVSGDLGFHDRDEFDDVEDFERVLRKHYGSSFDRLEDRVVRVGGKRSSAGGRHPTDKKVHGGDGAGVLDVHKKDKQLGKPMKSFRRLRVV